MSDVLKIAWPRLAVKARGSEEKKKENVFKAVPSMRADAIIFTIGYFCITNITLYPKL